MISSEGARPASQSIPFVPGRPPRICESGKARDKTQGMAQKQIHLIVRGRVQGVFYRASAAREAKRLGLTGWVKNRQDGAVEMVIEGEEDQVKDFLSWAQHGPSTARVEGVETRWRSYTGEHPNFRILG